MTNNDSSTKKPLLRFIEAGLKLWVKSQCKSIEKLDLKLEGATLRILRGEIDSVKISAKKINFRNIFIEEIDVVSGPITIALNFSIYNPSILLKDSFIINSKLSLQEIDLNNTINSSEWNWMNNWFAENLLDGNTYNNIFIKNGKLGINYLNTEKNSSAIKYLSLETASRTIKLTDPTSASNVLLPMDPAICIENIELYNDSVFIQLSSVVHP